MARVAQKAQKDIKDFIGVTAKVAVCLLYTSFGGHAYDGLMIAVSAIERAGGTDKAKVRDEIEKTKGFIGTAGVFNMSPQDHMGLNLDAFKLVEVRNGAWKMIE